VKQTAVNGRTPPEDSHARDVLPGNLIERRIFRAARIPVVAAPFPAARAGLVIQVDPEILSGTPVFARTRVPVATLLEYLERGQSLAEFLTAFPP